MKLMQMGLLPLWHQDTQKGENTRRSLVIVLILFIFLFTCISIFTFLFIILLNGLLALGSDLRQLLPIKGGSFIPLAKGEGVLGVDLLFGLFLCVCTFALFHNPETSIQVMLLLPEALALNIVIILGVADIIVHAKTMPFAIT
jgi:hypothetical protein